MIRCVMAASQGWNTGSNPVGSATFSRTYEGRSKQRSRNPAGVPAPRISGIGRVEAVVSAPTTNAYLRPNRPRMARLGDQKVPQTSHNLRIAARGIHRYFAATITGGFHVPSPGGKIDGGVSFGQYRRITR
jgi:hypothetical protein